MLIVSLIYLTGNIEAHTRPSAATGPAWTNRRAAAMGSRVNANFIVSKGLLDELREQYAADRSPYTTPLFIAKPDYRRMAE